MTESLPPVVAEPLKSSEDRPADNVVPTSVESSDSTFVVPLTEVELTKQYTKEHKVIIVYSRIICLVSVVD